MFPGEKWPLRKLRVAPTSHTGVPWSSLWQAEQSSRGGHCTLGNWGSSLGAPARRALTLLWLDQSQRTASLGLPTLCMEAAAICSKWPAHSRQPKKKRT